MGVGTKRDDNREILPWALAGDSVSGVPPVLVMMDAARRRNHSFGKTTFQFSTSDT
jgi:hypothetical protein